METDAENNRKRKEISSVSELDTSGATNNPQEEQSRKQKKKKKPKTDAVVSESINQEESQSKGAPSYPNLVKQLEEINRKLSNVLRKDDGFLRDLIKEMFQQMKEEFLGSVNKRIEILEGRLFEKDQDNDNLLKDIEKLNTQIEEKNLKIEEQKTENKKLSDQIETVNLNMSAKLNEMEQYNRKTNIRINGIPEVGIETAEDTTLKVIETINNTFKDINLRSEHVNIAHRLGMKKANAHHTKSPRQIIVKFHSRMKRDELLKRRRELKGTNIYISEDLTPINQHVLACLRKKMPDEIEQSWSKRGRLYYKSKSNKDNIKEVEYKDFQMWIDLPWPTN